MIISVLPARLFALSCAILILVAVGYFPRRAASIAAAQDFTPAGELRELSIDDGLANCTVGLRDRTRPDTEQQTGLPGFGWANKLTPATYPSTLRAVTIGFNRVNQLGNEVLTDALYRIVIYLDPEMDGPSNGQQPAASFIGRVRGTDQFMTFNLFTPLTITQGSFVVGAIDEIGGAGFPALLDTPGRSIPPGSESFSTSNSGTSWDRLSEIFATTPKCDPLAPGTNAAGSWLIRATVESNPVETVSGIGAFTDSDAVEPWGVAIGGLGVPQALATNIVSDNVTVIRVSNNNTFGVIPVGDGPGGTPDGPFGVVASGGLAFVTLFGSNTIPTKEFPIDYSALALGRVAVLMQATDGGPFSQARIINVGTGPMFPALVPTANGLRLYVPCAGSNRVDVINAINFQKVAEVAVGQNPSSCTASINNSKVYVTNFGDGSISVINTATNQVIKTIPAPPVRAASGATATAANPWQGAISTENANLYVTYWGTVGGVSPNGGIAEFDTCRDEFVRAIVDDSTAGTPAGSAGGSGIPAPAAPLTRDPVTGTTPGAGGGGGGPFGIASCPPSGAPMVFTNDGGGFVGLLDTRIDQVVSSLPNLSAFCPKPRGIACGIDPRTPPPNQRPRQIVFVACGQPENSVFFFTMPQLPENISNVPVIDSFKVSSNRLTITGSGFTEDTRLEVIVPGSTACLTFEKEIEVRKSGTEIRQKGRLSDGRRLKNVGGIIRVINPDGSVRILPLTLVGTTGQ